MDTLDTVITLGGSKPRQVAKTVLFILLFGYASGRFTASVFRHGLKRTIMYLGFLVWKQYKGESGYKEEMTNVRKSFQKSLYIQSVKDTKINKVLPSKGLSNKDILTKLRKWSAHDEELWNGKRRMSSGAVYHGQKDLTSLQNEAYSLFSISNPLHPDVFPFCRKLESEIIAMTISLFGGDVTKQKGMVTSGGTESICMAVRAYKNWARRVKGIYHPQLIIPQTAHCAFTKACEMYEIECVPVRPNPKTFAVEAAEIEKYINSNTIAIVCSAPQYAQGVLDPVKELSKLALQYNVGLHVDCCLGSFLMPILQKMGYDIPPFDFVCPGVTTISCDTHKFGYAQKGTSVLMFKNNELRRDAYFAHTESSIGIYCTPTIQGSRSGGVLASCWSAMMSLGEDGYRKEAKLIMDAVDEIKKGISEIDGLKVAGNPVMAAVGFISEGELDVYKVSSAMSDRGWTLNNCKDPPCPHMCVTRANCIKVMEKFVEDLKSSVKDVKDHPENFKNCDGAMYGVMVELPDSGAQNDILYEYLDVMLGLVDEQEAN